MNQSRVNMFLSALTAPIVLAHLIDFLIRRCFVNPQCSNIHPANLIRYAYSRYEYVCANRYAVITERNILIPLCLFIQTSPIDFAVAAEKEIYCLQGNCTFKWQINFDRHNAGLKFNYCLRFDPRHFSLLSTFKIYSNTASVCEIMNIWITVACSDPYSEYGSVSAGSGWFAIIQPYPQP
jgi:hypothetical protein